MDTGTTLALTTAWWSWDCPQARDAFWAGVLPTFLASVDARLRVLRGEGRWPSEWKHLTCLRRNEKNVARVSQGKINPSVEFLFGVASLLGVDLRELFPPNDELLARAALHLATAARRARYEQAGLSPQQAFARALAEEGTRLVSEAAGYATHMLKNLATLLARQRAWTAAEIACTLAGLDHATRAAIERIAALAAPTLDAADARISQRECAKQ